MSIETWLAFVAASTILLVIPGPTILLVISYALGQGWRAALPISIGVALGDFTAMTLSMLGVGALLPGRSVALDSAVRVASGAARGVLFMGTRVDRDSATTRDTADAQRQGQPEARSFRRQGA